MGTFNIRRFSSSRKVPAKIDRLDIRVEAYASTTLIPIQLQLAYHAPKWQSITILGLLLKHTENHLKVNGVPFMNHSGKNNSWKGYSIELIFEE